MSHFTEITVNFLQQYEGELVAALKEIFGGDVEVHADGQELRSYTGAKATNAGLGHTEKCHIIIRQKTLKKVAGEHCMTNDAGYERTKDGKYRVFIDTAGFSRNLQDQICQSYAEKVSTKQLESQGYQVTKVRNPNGTVRLEATIWS